MSTKFPLDEEAMKTAFTQISPLGNAACILGFYATQVKNAKLRRQLLAATNHADKACSLLNKIVYPKPTKAQP